MIYGVDLSYANGKVDFDELKKHVDFVILRVAWIGNNSCELDSQFKRNYKEAKAKGLLVGGYVYSYCESEDTIKRGVDFVLNNLQEEEFELPLYLDLEDKQISYINKDDLTSLALTFCENIESGSDLKAGVYANLDWFNNHLNLESLIRYDVPLWIAHWNNDPYSYENSAFEIMQYEVGEIEGLEGEFDKNVMYRLPEESELDSENDEIVGSYDLKIPYKYYNGSTIEKVYSDSELTRQIGFLNPYEICCCLGVYKNKAIVLYAVDKELNTKIGFVKWLGGVVNEN